MKRRTMAVGLLSLVMLGSFMYFVAIPRISVSGTGTVTAYPDEADLLFSVRTQNVSATNAAVENGFIMTVVYSSLDALGVNKSDVKTVSYSLQPTYDSYNYSKVIGYVAINSVEVIVTGTENLPNVGRIIDVIVQAGVNQIDGITFTFAGLNYNSLRAQAYHKAVEDANSQASAIVTGVGGVIVGMASISTNYGYGILPQPIVYEGSTTTKPPTPINSGLQQVTATVNITYLYI
ncbi:MAG TPA: SIMPL domain-containing protein [Methylomirabilota bacterium]|nr:SIMPL domain-containing protein [Methylomirabilota bacterium]